MDEKVRGCLLGWQWAGREAASRSINIHACVVEPARAKMHRLCVFGSKAGFEVRSGAGTYDPIAQGMVCV